MARNGKIARLELDIRNELNRRLQDGESGTSLLKWLNGLKPVREVIKEQFNGMPVSEQNLSEWRQGGYKDWVRLEAARDFIEDITEQSWELDEAAGEELISDRFGSVLAAEMAQLAMKFLEQEEDLEKRWNRLKEINREFSRMRRDDHRGVRTWIKRAQWEREQELDEEEEAEKMRGRERVAALFAPSGGALWGKVSGPRVQGSGTDRCKLKVEGCKTKRSDKMVGRSPSSPPSHKASARQAGHSGEGETLAASRDEQASNGTHPSAHGGAHPPSLKATARQAGVTRPTKPKETEQPSQKAKKSGPPTSDFGATSLIKPNQTKNLDQDGQIERDASAGSSLPAATENDISMPGGAATGS